MRLKTKGGMCKFKVFIDTKVNKQAGYQLNQNGKYMSLNSQDMSGLCHFKDIKLENESIAVNLEIKLNRILLGLQKLKVLLILESHLHCLILTVYYFK